MGNNQAFARCWNLWPLLVEWETGFKTICQLSIFGFQSQIFGCVLNTTCLPFPHQFSMTPSLKTPSPIHWHKRIESLDSSNLIQTCWIACGNAWNLSGGKWFYEGLTLLKNWHIPHFSALLSRWFSEVSPGWDMFVPTAGRFSHAKILPASSRTNEAPPPWQHSVAAVGGQPVANPPSLPQLLARNTPPKYRKIPHKKCMKVSLSPVWWKVFVALSSVGLCRVRSQNSCQISGETSGFCERKNRRLEKHVVVIFPGTWQRSYRCNLQIQAPWVL